MQKLLPPKRIVESRARARELLVRARKSWIVFKNAVDRSVAERADTAFRVCGELAEQSFLKDGEYARIAAIEREKRKSLGERERGRIDEELLEAARTGDISRVRELILNGADVNAQDNNGNTAGHFAAWNGRANCLRVLTEAGLNVNVQNRDGQTAGHWAAEHGHTECLKILVEAGLNVNVQNDNGNTAGHSAAWNGHTECLRVLIEAGLDVTIQNNDGWTAGHSAVLHGHTECLRILEEAERRWRTEHPGMFKRFKLFLARFLRELGTLFRDKHA